MLRRLSNIFNQNQSSKLLDFAGVNQSKSDLVFAYLDQIKKSLGSDAVSQLLAELERGWASDKPIIRLKHCIATHYLIVQTLNQAICNRCTTSTAGSHHSAKKQQGPEQWIRSNIVDYYWQYLQRLSSHVQLFQSCLQTPMITLQQLQSIELTTNCFKVVNLLNFILKSQVNLNKIGRYYPKLTIMCQLFAMYIKDIKVFYNLLELTIDAIFHYYSQLSNEMLRHSFVFVVEVQKTLDRLQEFLHNRYFYKTAGIPLPNVKQVDSAKYKQLVRHIRATDKTIDIPRVIPIRTKKERLDELNQTMMNGDSRRRRGNSSSKIGTGERYTSFIETVETSFQEKFTTMFN